MLLLCQVSTLISLSLTAIHNGREEVFSVGVTSIEGVLPMKYGTLGVNLETSWTRSKKDGLIFLRKNINFQWPPRV